MKRDYCFSNRESLSSTGSCGSSGNAKMWPDGGFDELFAAVGYSVRSSEMAEVAQKMEQLEEAMGTVQQGGLSQLVPETVHYNPSDLSSWVESMLSGLNPEPGSGYYSTCLDPYLDSSTFTAGAGSNNTIVSVSSGQVDLDDFGSDLIAIPGKAVFKPPSPTPQVKKLKSSPFLEAPVKALQSETFRPVVLVDSQENGVRLVHTLMACAEAVQQEKLKLAEALVKNVGFLAVSQAGAMRKVATYFAEALARRIYRMCPAYQHDSAFTDLLQMHFYETCPYLKFAHFTANQAILEAFAGKNRVHVIDFSMKQGMQWPALLQALALRPGGPPSFRLTGIGSSPPDDKDHLQEVGWKLARLAESINVEFEYRSFVANSLADLNAAMFETRVGEAVAVNSIFELHPLLAQPGAINKVLQVVRNLTPEILTVVEQEANHNDDSFLDRFTESLHYYSTLFDSLESGGTASNEAATAHDRLMTEIYLGRQICNVVACEGADRVERHEVLARWKARFLSSGFNQVHLGSNAYKQASMLLALFAGGDGYMVEENNGCLMLGWHTRPLIAASAWKLA